MDTDQILLRDPQVIWRVLQDELVLVRPTSGEIRVLNSVGAFLWQTLDGELTAAELAKRVTQSYQVSQPQAEADVLAFLEELAREEWLSIRPSAGSG
jgi:hypothetical protein